MKRNKIVIAGGIFFLLLLTACYLNHFDNSFQFDDSHTIVNNLFIRDAQNIPLFFKDATTFSSNPNNQMYRPLMTTLFTLDYELSGEKGYPRPLWFHIDTYFWYVIQLVAMYFFMLHIFNKAFKQETNKIAALLTTAVYGIHTANAETINYISSRSDSLSTCFLILGFVIYFAWPEHRNKFIYLIPVAVGVLVKQAVLVFPGLLFIYILLFETDLKERIANGLLWTRIVLRFVLPSLILCIFLFALQAYMTPETYQPGGLSAKNYIITQPYVWLHYFQNFLLPIKLSADTDLMPFQSILDSRFFIGVLFVITMLYIAWRCSKSIMWRPVTFGILWYFISLLPTSLIPFSEVMNDHRPFFPYVGLIISAAWPIVIFCKTSQRARAATLLACLLIGGHAMGTYKRNEVWHNSESLWRDVVKKSPKNGRAWMNYGLSLMEKGDYAGAERCYNQAKKIVPDYPYLHINLGILTSQTGRVKEAEQHFLHAIRKDPRNGESYFYYGKFLSEQNRKEEAIQNLEYNLTISPGHLQCRYLLMSLYQSTGREEKLRSLAHETLKLVPGDNAARQYLIAPVANSLDDAIKAASNNPSENTFIALSLEFYKAGKYEQSVSAAQEALKMNPQSFVAYNNICSAYNMLGEFSKARTAGFKALEINPDFQLARNNIALGEKLERESGLYINAVRKDPSGTNFRALSLYYYKQGMIQKAIDAAKAATEKDAKDVESFSIICSGYNALGNYKEAIEYCEQALKIDPNYFSAKNSLSLAKSMLGVRR